jgi:hypothetical protein
MERTTLIPRPLSALCAIGGPVAAGAVLGLPLGVTALAARATMLPAIYFSVMALMVPALYIGITLIGRAPPAREIAVAVGRAARACGLVWLGVAPAAAFVLTSIQGRDVIAAGGMAMIWVGVAIALRVLWDELGMFQAPVPAKLLFIAWAVVAQGIGGRMVVEVLS